MTTIYQTSFFDNDITPARRKYEILATGAIKGCIIIYAPAGRANEYSKLACNPYAGCGHGCNYCYVPKQLKMSKAEFDCPQPRKDFIKRLHNDARKYQAMGINEQVLLSFTTDPYNPLDEKLQLTRQTIRIIQSSGLSVVTLTKGGSRALRDLDLFRPGKDSFASTLTTLNEKESRKWEPYAALPLERIETLKAFHEAGIFTWVSLEPVFDPSGTIEIIEQTHEFVDHYKLGKMNYVPMNINWSKFARYAVKLFDDLGCDYYVKRDLREYL